MLKIFALAIAGAAGTVSRYLLGGWVHQLFGAAFPYGTLAVNVSGCLAVGFLGTLAEERLLFSPQIRTALLIGFLGAFTTFSSFAYETWTLFKDGEAMMASLNILASMVTCFAGLLMGVLFARLI
jgi:CrcB protein